MKALLISANRTTEPYPVFPLGLATIAEALRRAGHQVDAFDCLWDGDPAVTLAELIRASPPQMVGISVRNIDNENSLHEERYLEDVRSLVTLVRGCCDVPIILGGAGFSIMPEQILAYTGADYGVAGEGDRLMVAFADSVERGERPDTKILRQALPLTRGEISAGTYDPIWVQRYMQHGGGCGVQTKRGCPHHCVYCTYPAIEGNLLRPRDPVAVVDEVEWLGRHCPGASIFFTDSVFNDDQGYYLEVVEELKRRGSRVPWSAYFKPTGLTAERIARMKETGLKSVEMGADAASDATLRGLGKGFTFADIERSNTLLSEHGVPTAQFLMFGGPGETPETVVEGIENLKRLEKAVIFPFMGIRILPGTKLMALAVREGVLASDANLMEPHYYLSPQVGRAWLEKTLTDGFSTTPNIVFPPDAMQGLTRTLRALGHGGSLWELLTVARLRRPRDRKPVV